MHITNEVLSSLSDLFTHTNLIPASAIVAIALFFSKEHLESKRKKQAKLNDINALKKIFARECQLNWNLRTQVKSLCSKFEPFEKQPSNVCPYSLSFVNSPSGKTRYEIYVDGKKSTAGVLTKPYLENFQKYIYDIAKLEPYFYDLLVPAYEAVIELKHLYDSLIDLEQTQQLMNHDNMMVGFSSYALGELETIDKDLKALYQFCTGNELTQGLLR